MVVCSLILTFAQVIKQRKSMTEQFEDQLHQDLHQFLLSMKEVDERMP